MFVLNAYFCRELKFVAILRSQTQIFTQKYRNWLRFIQNFWGKNWRLKSLVTATNFSFKSFSPDHHCVQPLDHLNNTMFITTDYSTKLYSSGSPLCSATPRQWLCAPGVPQFFASPLEAVQGLPPHFLHLKNCYYLSIKSCPSMHYPWSKSPSVLLCLPCGDFSVKKGWNKSDIRGSWVL